MPTAGRRLSAGNAIGGPPSAADGGPLTEPTIGATMGQQQRAIWVAVTKETESVCLGRLKIKRNSCVFVRQMLYDTYMIGIDVRKCI